jgi:hypothetical protein
LECDVPVGAIEGDAERASSGTESDVVAASGQE